MKKLISTKMKVFMVFLFITSITCFASSAVVLYNSNFKFSDYTNWDNWNINWGYNHYTYNNYDKTVLDEPLTDITNLNIDFNGYDVVVQLHSGNNIIINTNINSTESISSDYLTVNKSDKTLSISPKNINKNVLVKIPSTYSKNLSLNFTSGSADLSNITLEALNIQGINSDLNLNNLTCTSSILSTTNGNITLNNITSNDLSVDTLNGEVYLTNLKGNITIKTISSNIFANLTNEITNGSFNSTNGNIELQLPSDNNFLIDYNTVNGELDTYSASSNTSNFNITSNNRNHKIKMGTGITPISITTIDGDLSL